MTQEMQNLPFAIFTDTSANLPTPLLRKYRIGVIPFSYSVNGKKHVCVNTETFKSAAYYGAIRAGADVMTAQINPQAYIDALSPALSAGLDVLFVGMSSGISGSFRSAELAAQELRAMFPSRTVRLVDTLGASLGEGILRSLLIGASWIAMVVAVALTIWSGVDYFLKCRRYLL